MRKFEITEEQIKNLLNFSALVDINLRRWFPDAFEPEWEEVPLSWFQIDDKMDVTLLRDTRVRFDSGPRLPFQITINPKSAWKDEYKIEDGKIWRRKA
jgi:hypothetical protein